MPSTFSGIEIGKRGLEAHTRGLTTIGHNIGNSSVDGYSRQRVEMQASLAIFSPGQSGENTAGQIGQGVNVASINRIRDTLLERRIISQETFQGFWKIRDESMLKLENIYNEPTDHSIRSRFDQFWSSWQELSLHPSELASRRAVLQRAETLSLSINKRFLQLSELRSELEDTITGKINIVNNFVEKIATLNKEILRLESQGNNPNDLYDQRDFLVGKLASLIDIAVVGKDPNEFTIHTGGSHLVQGQIFRTFSTITDPTNEGLSSVVWLDTQAEVDIRSGELKALIDFRDIDVRSEIQKLDLLTINFIDLVNEIHERSFDLGGSTNSKFFIELQAISNVSGNIDRNSDGIEDSSYIFRISGVNELNLKDQIGLQGTLTLPGPDGDIEIPYFPSDTVEMVLERVNLSGVEMVMRLNQANKLTVKGTPSVDVNNPEFVIRHLQDSGEFLVNYAGILNQSGENGGFDWRNANAISAFKNDDVKFSIAPLAHPSAWIAVNPDLKRDPTRIAAAFDFDSNAFIGNGNAALAIAGLRTESVMIGINATFDDYFADVTADVGLRGEQAAGFRASEDAIMKQLNDMRESISGVNLDEEFSEMIKYQQAFAAAARFISQIDQMLDTIVNRMGV